MINDLVVARREFTLEDRAESINRHIDKAHSADASSLSHRLRAGQELPAVRALIPPGEWLAWCEAHIKRGHRDIQRLMKIAGAEDPDGAIAIEREDARVGMQK